jgi:hypothetical protein
LSGAQLVGGIVTQAGSRQALQAHVVPMARHGKTMVVHDTAGLYQNWHGSLHLPCSDFAKTHQRYQQPYKHAWRLLRTHQQPSHARMQVLMVSLVRLLYKQLQVDTCSSRRRQGWWWLHSLGEIAWDPECAGTSLGASEVGGLQDKGRVGAGRARSRARGERREARRILATLYSRHVQLRPGCAGHNYHSTEFVFCLSNHKWVDSRHKHMVT